MRDSHARFGACVTSGLRYPTKRWTPLLTPAVLCLLSLALSLILSGAPANADPDYPRLTGRVVDEAGILSDATKAQLTASLAAEEKKSGTQIVVVTIKSLQGTPIETFGYQLGRHWGIGQKGKNNGALFIVAPADHRMRIEVGYGLEEKLTDLQSAVIIHDIVTPQFKAGHFDQGVADGTNAILKVVGGGSVMDMPAPPRSDIDEAATFSVGAFILVACMIVFICWPVLLVFTFVRDAKLLHGAITKHSGGSSSSGSSDHDSSDSGSSSSSSSDADDFSGGGGDFGGGGASGSW
jgi:uncharacterized protein